MDGAQFRPAGPLDFYRLSIQCHEMHFFSMFFLPISDILFVHDVQNVRTALYCQVVTRKCVVLPDRLCYATKWLEYEQYCLA